MAGSAIPASRITARRRSAPHRQIKITIMTRAIEARIAAADKHIARNAVFSIQAGN
jgi:hypothetical protein